MVRKPWERLLPSVARLTQSHSCPGPERSKGARTAACHHTFACECAQHSSALAEILALLSQEGIAERDEARKLASRWLWAEGLDWPFKPDRNGAPRWRAQLMSKAAPGVLGLDQQPEPAPCDNFGFSLEPMELLSPGGPSTPLLNPAFPELEIGVVQSAIPLDSWPSSIPAFLGLAHSVRPQLIRFIVCQSATLGTMP